MSWKNAYLVSDLRFFFITWTQQVKMLREERKKHVKNNRKRLAGMLVLLFIDFWNYCKESRFPRCSFLYFIYNPRHIFSSLKRRLESLRIDFFWSKNARWHYFKYWWRLKARLIDFFCPFFHCQLSFWEKNTKSVAVNVFSL